MLQNKGRKKPEACAPGSDTASAERGRPRGGKREGLGPRLGGSARCRRRWGGGSGGEAGEQQKRSPARPGQGIPAEARRWLAPPAEYPRSPLHTPGGRGAPVRGGGCGGDARGAASPASGPAAGPHCGTPPRRGEEPRTAVSSHHTSLLAPLGARQSYLISSTASPAGSSSLHPCGTELGSCQSSCGC